MLDLERIYRANNKKYWHGLLPKEVVVEFSELIPKGNIEGIHIPEAKIPWPRGCGPKPSGYTIRLRQELDWLEMDAVSHMSLLHSMVHMEGVLGNKALYAHGDAFHNRMNQLANVGAFDRWW